MSVSLSSMQRVNIEEKKNLVKRAQAKFELLVASDS